MLSIQQLIKALRQLQNNSSNAMTAATTAIGGGASGGDLLRSLKHVVAADAHTTRAAAAAAETTAPATHQAVAAAATTLVDTSVTSSDSFALSHALLSKQHHPQQQYLPQQQQQQQRASNSSQSSNSTQTENQLMLLRRQRPSNAAATTTALTQCDGSQKFSVDSCVLATGCSAKNLTTVGVNTANEINKSQHNHHHHQQSQPQQQKEFLKKDHSRSNSSSTAQSFYLQQLQHFHTAQQQQQPNLFSKQKQTQFAMSSLAAEQPRVLKQEELQSEQLPTSPLAAATVVSNGVSNGNVATTPLVTASGCDGGNGGTKANAGNCSSSSAAASSNSKPCFNTGLGEILQFMELIGNLKHTKRTGWVLRDVNDCESISGHMYRMSMMTFLLDGSEGLNQIRCMELALVHDLAESLVGDITPFCGVTKTEKRAMEFKAMADICKLIEPRGKRIMELFEEYEEGESAESKFVKDLDRLDMVMQAFEYEKRDNCLLKHQEFFDSTAGKFNHPFVKKLVEEIYEQRRSLAKDKGATPPPPVEVPSMEEPPTTTTTATTPSAADQHLQQQTSSSTSS